MLQKREMNSLSTLIETKTIVRAKYQMKLTQRTMEVVPNCQMDTNELQRTAKPFKTKMNMVQAQNTYIWIAQTIINNQPSIWSLVYAA